MNKQQLEQQLGQWYPVVAHLFSTPLMENIGKHLGADIDKLCPPLPDIFKAFRLTPPDKVKIVLIGQDPYPVPGDAMGLCFSTHAAKTPYSLREIFKALEREGYGNTVRTDNDLTDWAEQGVLMLNASLTTRQNEPNAHANIGWDKFISTALSTLRTRRIIWLGWGKFAQRFIDSNANNLLHIKIYTNHPAAVRYGHDFNPQFHVANKVLIAEKLKPIQWTKD